MCVSTGILLAGLVTGCSAGGTELEIDCFVGSQQTEQASQADLESLLISELKRLGKSPSQAAPVPPRGTDNDPFDLCALLIDPDGEGGSKPLGVELSWTERLVGDYNNDGLVNLNDIAPIGQHYGATIEYRDPAEVEGVAFWPQYHPEWAPPDHRQDWVLARIDGNGDGEINAADLTPIAQHWMEQLAGYRLYYKTPPLEQWFPVSEAGQPSQQLEIPRGYPPGRSSLINESHILQTQDPAYYRLKVSSFNYADSALAVVSLNAQGEEGTWSIRNVQRDHPSWSQCFPPDYLETSFGRTVGPFDARAVLLERVDNEAQASPAVLLSWTERLMGDGDLSGSVNIFDILTLGQHFGEQVTCLDFYNDNYGVPAIWPVGDPEGKGLANWLLARADLNSDRQVGITDITVVGTQAFARLDGYFIYHRQASEQEYSRVPDSKHPARQLVVARPFGASIGFVPTHEVLLPSMNERDWVGIAPICLRGTGDDEGSIYPVPVWPGSISAPYGSDEPVIAVLTASNAHLHSGEETTLCAWSSYSQLGGIATYEWDLSGDGIFDKPEKLPFRQTRYFDPQELSPSVRVTNDDGLTASTSIPIVVGPQLPPGVVVGITLHDPGGLHADEELDVELSATNLSGATPGSLYFERTVACMPATEALEVFELFEPDSYAQVTVHLHNASWEDGHGYLSADSLSVNIHIDGNGDTYVPIHGYLD